MFGLLNSASAISAAFFIDCAAMPALPAADSGRIRPTLIWPVPIDVPCCAAADGGGLLLNTSGMPEQPASSASAPAKSKPRLTHGVREENTAAYGSRSMANSPVNIGSASPQCQPGILSANS